MREPITEVSVWVTSHPNGRVAGASLNGPGSSIHDMLARGATRETITASEGLFAAWMQDKTLHRYEWNGYTLQRLPLATPEMVADKERLDWLDQCDVRLLDNLIGRIADGDPSRRVIDSHRMGGDAARAAGGAPHA